MVNQATVPDQATELTSMDKEVDVQKDHTPAQPAVNDDDKQMTLVEIVQESQVEKEKKRCESLKDLEAGEAGEAGATGKPETKKRKFTLNFRKSRRQQKDEKARRLFYQIRDPASAEVEQEKKPSLFFKVRKGVHGVFVEKPLALWDNHRGACVAAMGVGMFILTAAVIALTVVTVTGSYKTDRLARELSAAESMAPNGVVNNGVDVVSMGHRQVGGDSMSTMTALASATSDYCDDDSTAIPSVPIMSALANVSAVMATSVDVLTMSRPTVTAFMADSSLVPEIIVSTSSSATIHSTSTTIETCGEWGDGAGPCARPYGKPNPTPEAWLLSLSIASENKASIAGASTSFFPIGVPVADPTSVTTIGASSVSAALSSPAAISIADVSSSSSECGAPTTVYVTVTVSSGEPAANMSALGVPGTVYATSTSVVDDLLTVTYSGPSGPLTTTETVVGSNNTSGHQTVITHQINGTGALTTQTFTVPTYTLTLSSALTSATGVVPVTSGGDKAAAVPKPLAMGGSKSGNGVYCVVMLAALAALLL